MKKKYFSFNNINIFLLPFLIYFFFTITFKNYYYHDTLVSFDLFKHIYDYYVKFDEIPVWIDSVYGGVRITYSLIFFPFELISIFAILGKALDIQAYYIFLVYLSFLYSIFFIGLKKLISIQFNQSLTFMLLVLILIQCLGTNIFNEYLYTITIYILFPYYIYYFLKFRKNKKIQELFKISYIAGIKFFFILHYSFFIEVYFIIFLFLFCLYEKKFKFLLAEIKKRKNYIRLIPLFLLLFLCIYNYKIYETYEFFSNYRSSSGAMNFEHFISGGGGNLPQFKFHSFFSNFFWGESNLIISSLGLFLFFYSFFHKDIRETFIFKLSLFCIIFFVTLSFLPNYPSHLKNFVGKILFYLPLMKYQFHLFYLHLYTKIFLLIIILMGLNKLLSNFNDTNKIKKTLALYAVLNIVYYFLINKPSFYKTEIIISFIISVLSLFIFMTILFLLIYINKINIKNLKILIIFAILPSALYNFSIHSFSNEISTFKNDLPKFSKFREDVQKRYEASYFKNKFDSEMNINCLESKKIYNLIPSTHIKEFMPRGSTDYAENIYNQNIFSCKKIFYTTMIENEKKFDFEPKNFLYNDAIKIEFINNQNYLMKIGSHIKELKTNISYSIYWNVKNSDGKKIETFNNNNFLAFYPAGSKEFFLNYDNINDKRFIFFKFLFGFITVIFILYSVLRKTSIY